MADGAIRWVHLLDADPDLARGLDAHRAREVSARLVAPAFDVPRGPWRTPARALAGGAPPLALLVLDGLLMRETRVAAHPAAELLGPGDLLRAWRDADDDEPLVPRRDEWTALQRTRLAVIDPTLAIRAAQWPEVFSRLVARATSRAERLVTLQAIGRISRVDDRLLAMLWHLAERWGRVVPGGVLVDLRVPHRTLAGMIGARRPSVTTALGHLIARGEVERREGGGWILRGVPPVPRAGAAALDEPRAVRA
jgi:hypothetical protein